MAVTTLNPSLDPEARQARLLSLQSLGGITDLTEIRKVEKCVFLHHHVRIDHVDPPLCLEQLAIIFEGNEGHATVYFMEQRDVTVVQVLVFMNMTL
jgi:hypothetical protein